MTSSLFFVALWFLPSSAAPASRDATIALTFDLGGDAASVPAILAALRAVRVRATFFVTGRWAASHPLLLRRIVADGHALGNHSDTHADLTRLSDTRIAGELQRAEARVRRECGRSTRPLFRPPFGACDARVRRIAAALGYRVVLWSVDAHDSVKERVRPADIEDRVMMRATGRHRAAARRQPRDRRRAAPPAPRPARGGLPVGPGLRG